ncbi:hypothetical protein ASF12_18185 [Paenibacillus sp. Leaf72]|nr:hypothetical protein ASF12_18185 [Paenibacillus sp. Leaf72]
MRDRQQTERLYKLHCFNIVLCCYITLWQLLHIQFLNKKGISVENTADFLLFALTIFVKQVYNNSITEYCNIQILMIEVSVHNEQSA